MINPENTMFNVAAFYHFTDLTNLPEHQARLRTMCLDAQAWGTILIAPEGINGTIASAEIDLFKTMIEKLAETYQIPAVNLKWSNADAQPFRRLKIRIKREIITMNRVEARAAQVTGHHVSPHEWNDLITEPDVLLLDTRNDYETEFGTFSGAVTPPLKTFTDFADYVDTLDPKTHPKVAMFCTGGIRCEKASSYMINKGFKDVYQLQGGILKYLETIAPEESRWQGECFVFDERVALGHGLQETTNKSRI